MRLLPNTPYARDLRNNCPESIWMWVGPIPVSNAAKAWDSTSGGLPFDRHSPDYRTTRVHHLWSSVHVHVYVSMQRGNTWVAKRSIFYNTYSYVLRRHTRHPVELLRGEQCVTVDKDVLTLAPGRNVLIVPTDRPDWGQPSLAPSFRTIGN